MPSELLHRFEYDGKHFAIDPETCFCFECDAISRDVLDHYPHTPANRVLHLLAAKHDAKELHEVIGELEWLRATKSILAPPGKEDVQKFIQVERGLKRLSIVLARDTPEPKRGLFRGKTPSTSTGIPAIARDAVAVLLSRSGAQDDLEIRFIENLRIHDPDLIASLCTYALKMARLAGKNLTASICVTNLEIVKPPQALQGHTIGARLAFKDPSDVPTHADAFARAIPATLARLAKAIQPDAAEVTGAVTVRPGHPEFHGAVEELDKAGFGIVELDMVTPFVANPKLDPNAMLAGLTETAVYYAQRLLKQNYFRLDPIASLFWRIYNGTPQPRIDPIGTNEAAIDADGNVYPSAHLLGVDEFRLGSVADGVFDNEAVSRFDDVGALTTRGCLHCWARNLCGGGMATVHWALSGSFREPSPAWCEAQRAWMEAAVSAFNVLRAEGINFERIHTVLGKRTKPSLFTIARAALTMTIGVRPIEEADARMLTQWENWSEAAYFLFNESGILLATQYDREMDSLHPNKLEQELILTRRDGTPFGLFKLKPAPCPQTAQGALYMRDENDYAAESVRKGFRAILKEASAQQAVRALTIPAAVHEHALAAFLEALGFTRAGVQCEALYLHGAYHDVALYTLTTAAIT